eukprot:Hpha_TRINITY_DN14593_c0_g1::TRINITY_DN14593_c0_g1_i1::g.46422::m.46422/K01652/E2.2.1.6L, ilvB, ilvG, ilvI; acetolactate synthase I/II/III large subunit
MKRPREVLARLRDLINHGKVEQLDTVFDPVLMQPWTKLLHELCPAVPDLRWDYADDTLVEEYDAKTECGSIVFWATLSGTHSDAPYQGIPATGAPFRVEYFQLFKTKGDKVVARFSPMKPQDQLLEQMLAAYRERRGSLVPARQLGTPLPSEGTLGEAFVSVLAEMGITHLFGVSGGNILRFFDLAQDKFTIFNGKHEASSAFAGACYSWATGRPCIVAATAGPGALNLLNGVALAARNHVPLLVITGAVTSSMATSGSLQEVSTENESAQVDMFAPGVKRSFFVTTPERWLHELQQALNLMFTPPFGPTHISIPNNFWMLPTPAPRDFRLVVPAHYRPEHKSPHLIRVPPAVAPGLERLSPLLLEAKRPLLFLGGGAARCQEDLRALAETVGCRVVATVEGKGMFPEGHSLYAGVYGMVSHEAAIQAVHHADVVLIVGSSLAEASVEVLKPDNVYGVFERASTVAHIDHSLESFIAHAPCMPLVGDTAATVRSLLALVRQQPRGPGTWEGMPIEYRVEHPERFESDAVPLEPARVRKDLMEALPEDAVICADPSSSIFFSTHYLRLTSRQLWFAELKWASMGEITAGAVGLAVAYPGRPVIATVGDGCFLMNGTEVVTAVEHKLPIVWVVENNGEQNMVREGQRLCFHNEARYATFAQTISYATMAQGMGAAGMVVWRPGQLQGVLKDALALGGPVVVEVIVASRECPGLLRRLENLRCANQKPESRVPKPPPLSVVGEGRG